jgi:hypothetical protein
LQPVDIETEQGYNNKPSTAERQKSLERAGTFLLAEVLTILCSNCNVFARFGKLSLAAPPPNTNARRLPNETLLYED